MPLNVFNSNGAGTYTQAAGAGPGGLARWNFDFSVNTDWNGAGAGRKLDDLTYGLFLDFDPGLGTSFLVSFDPIALITDNSIGDNSTAQGGGTEDAANYATLIANNNLAQNSENYGFFDNPPPFDPNAPGLYTIRLVAYDGGDEVASTEINVYVPEPATMTLLLGGLAALGIARRRKATA